MTRKPLLIIVNGLPGAGKTTLAKRLAADLGLPVVSRDALYEALYDALECRTSGPPPPLGMASFALLYKLAGTVLAAGRPLIVEGFFGRPDVRRAEFLQLRQRHDFEPLEIVCTADGRVLMERFLARMQSGERHTGHQDRDWLEDNKSRLLGGQLPALAMGGQIINIDTTTPSSFEYAEILKHVQAALSAMQVE